MKLTVYDKSNSHPALTYKGKRIITVCRDGSMYLSKILSRELKLHAGNRLGIARDDDRPKDWYMFVSDDENGFMIWNDPRCARFSNWNTSRSIYAKYSLTVPACVLSTTTCKTVLATKRVQNQ